MTGTLSERTGDAREGEVCEFRLPARSDRKYMIHMEARFLPGLGQAAILTPLFSPPLNLVA